MIFPAQVTISAEAVLMGNAVVQSHFRTLLTVENVAQWTVETVAQWTVEITMIQLTGLRPIQLLFMQLR